MNCWKTKYGYGGTSIDLCTTYYMSVGGDDAPYTFAECYRDGPDCLASHDSPLNCQWNQPTPPPPPMPPLARKPPRPMKNKKKAHTHTHTHTPAR